jgi:hypothetical protein
LSAIPYSSADGETEEWFPGMLLAFIISVLCYHWQESATNREGAGMVDKYCHKSKSLHFF